MNNVLFLFSANDVSFALFPYLLKYKVESETNFINKPYYVGDIDSSVLNGKFKFKFKDTNINLFYLKDDVFSSKENILSNLNDFAKEIFYDKVYIFREWSTFNKNLKSFGNVEIIYYKADENFHITDEEVKEFLSEYRIISSASISFSDKNFYFEPLINLFVFYYIFGFDYLSYSKLDVKKTNLMGMYYIKSYKSVRDKFYDEFIKPIFEKQNTELVKIYDTQCDKPQLISQLLQKYKGYWSLNHNAMYSDYITSVCGFIFDTLNHTSIDGPANATGRSYINEKALKGIIYSKLNIPFIIDTNTNNFEILNKLGFWFLNSEFYQFDTDKLIEEKVIPMENSIINAMEYLISIYKENDCDLDKTHQSLVEKYGDKMQNNYNTFIKYLTDAPNSDKLLNFILYGNEN